MLATLVPVFRRDMSVGAYMLFAQKENHFMRPHLLGTGRYDGAGNITGIEVLNNLTFSALNDDAVVFVPVNNISIFAEISAQYTMDRKRLVLLVDNTVKPEPTYLNRILKLKEDGFKIALNNIHLTKLQQYKPVLKAIDYLFLKYESADPEIQSMICNKIEPGMTLGMLDIPTALEFDETSKSQGFELFEGPFYRVPVHKDDTQINPLKVNYLKLMKYINTPDFDLDKVADIISRDAALTMELLNVVNKLTVNSNIASIKQATALLGQKELTKWLNTSLIKNLCADKPNEITRVSLIRAKFAESLSKSFNIAMRADELFLLGLFSVLDYVLDRSMEEALEEVSVAKDIHTALVKHRGPLAELYDFMLEYEQGNWPEVSRIMVLRDIDMDDVYDAYVEAHKWYKKVFS
ncbi:MAG: HDOD domain-containing protein [Pseudobutyrivibrio sp.]|nr:HDOD domain-containing protein [Pseudobutyrivibrio sp.]